VDGSLQQWRFIMAKESESKPKGTNVTIRTGKNGAKQIQHTTQTKKGMKRTIYDYPPKK